MFFSCYEMIHTYREKWMSEGQWLRIKQQKPIFIEQRHNKENNQEKRAYAEAVATSKKGAIMLAVCKGKISEGLNFQDDLGRLVVVVGIPFASIGAQKVRLKMEFMNGREHKSGDEWYMKEGMRAVNQAIGRVIRHQQDYGAILLLDIRYSRYTHQKQLSKWLRD